LKKIIVLAVVTLSLVSGLAGAAQGTPERTTNAPPPVPASISSTDLPALTRELAKLHVKPHERLSVRELKALGLRPVSKQLAARFKQLARSTRAKAATAGATYWFTTPYYGQVWVDVYYDGPTINPFGDTVYEVYSNFKICDVQGNNCIPLNAYTLIKNIGIDGTYYYTTPVGGFLPDDDGFPVYGFGPFSG
jgi:hypothetical protein